MRDLKFRCYYDNKMHKVLSLDFNYKKINLLGADIINFEDGKIMQYTGLKDKNGVEIYEGDIILTQPLRTKPFSKNHKSKRLKGIVQYEVKSFRSFPNKMYEAGWGVEIIDKESFKKYRCWDWGLFLDCEVIGNIYENPELLKGE